MAGRQTTSERDGPNDITRLVSAHSLPRVYVGTQCHPVGSRGTVAVLEVCKRLVGGGQAEASISTGAFLLAFWATAMQPTGRTTRLDARGADARAKGELHANANWCKPKRY